MSKSLESTLQEMEEEEKDNSRDSHEDDIEGREQIESIYNLQDGVDTRAKMRLKSVIFTDRRQSFFKRSKKGEQYELTKLISLLIEKYGSILAGWTKGLDSNGDNSLSFAEFTAGCVRIGFQTDTSKVWAHLNTDHDASLSLLELDEDTGLMYNAMKDWANDTFGGPIEWFSTMDIDGVYYITKAQYLESCYRYNAPCADDETELNDFWLGIQLREDRCISENLLFLEKNVVKKKCIIDVKLKERIDKVKENRISMIKKIWDRRIKSNCMLRDFKNRILETNTNFLAGWRQVFDRDGNLNMSKAELFKGCTQIAFQGDVRALWRALDIDGSGFVTLNEIDYTSCFILAQFKRWSYSFGSVTSLIERLLEKKHCRGIFGAADLNMFKKAMIDMGYDRHDDLKMIFDTSDLRKRGVVTVRDFEYLHVWKPPLWMDCDGPNLTAGKKFRKILQKRYGSLLRAWKKLLDTDSSNRVDWREFQTATEKLKNHYINDRIGVIWKTLDDDDSGYITLEELDPQAYETLITFYRWANENFGSVESCVLIMSGRLYNISSLQPKEFREMLKHWAYPQNDKEIRFLIHTLDSSNRGFISMESVRFLDTWQDERDYICQPNYEYYMSIGKFNINKDYRDPNRKDEKKKKMSQALVPFKELGRPELAYTRSSFEHAVMEEVKLRMPLKDVSLELPNIGDDSEERSPFPLVLKKTESMPLISPFSYTQGFKYNTNVDPIGRRFGGNQMCTTTFAIGKSMRRTYTWHPVQKNRFSNDER